MTTYYGIDLAKKQWLVASFKDKYISYKLVNTLCDIYFNNDDIIVIDMPVVLPQTIDEYPRKWDIQAKKQLGRKHGSIFYAPLKKDLDRNYIEINKDLEKQFKPKLSKQSFNLFPAIQDLQKLIKKHPNLTIQEGHPELYFNQLDPQINSKHTKKGIEERISLLKNNPLSRYNSGLHNWQSFCKTKIFQPDDFCDATSMLYHAYNSIT